MSTTTANAEAARGRVRVETGSKRIRAYLGGEIVADTTTPLLVWEHPYYPTHYFPLADVRGELLEADGAVVRSPSRGDGRRFSVRAGGKLAQGAAIRHERSPLAALRDALRLEWDAMDAWFEEDEEVFTHPRDPYTRVDILASSRHVRIEVDGITLAESMSPRLLLETGLPVRYYLPKPHVRMELLTPTDTVSHCPYKGQAEWWSVRAGDRMYHDLSTSTACFRIGPPPSSADGRRRPRRRRDRGRPTSEWRQGGLWTRRSRRGYIVAQVQQPQGRRRAARRASAPSRRRRV